MELEQFEHHSDLSGFDLCKFRSTEGNLFVPYGKLANETCEIWDQPILVGGLEHVFCPFHIWDVILPID